MSSSIQDKKDKGTPLSVLILEDREADAELMLHELRAAGYDPTWKRVQTENDFRQHLEPALDIILADYNLPGFTGLQALNILTETNLDIPVIVVTGVIEETALECLKRGAVDYLLKDRLRRLGPAVKKALEERRIRENNKRAAEALRASEQRYRGVAETALTGISIIDPDLNITYTNTAFSEMLGYKNKELLGMSLTNLFDPEDFPQIRTRADQRKEGLSSQYETKMIRKDGEVRTVIVSASPLTSKEGVYEGSQAVITDITERVKAEEKFKIIFESAPDPYYLSDLKGKFLDGNKAAERLMGYLKEELIGNSFLNLDLLPKNQLLKAAGLLAKNVLGQSTGPDEFTINTKDGGEVEVEIITRPVEIEGNTLVLGIARDITERVQAEKALGESEEKLRLMIDNSPIGFSATDMKGNYINVNPAMCLMVGYSQKELLSKHFDLISHPDDRENNQEMYQKLVQGNIEYFDLEKRYIHKNGKIIHVLIRSQLARNYDGEPLFEFSLIENITERKLAAEEVQQRTEDLTLINMINTAVNRGMDLPEILKLLTKKANRVFNCKSTTIYLCSEDHKYLEMKNLAMPPATVKRIEKLIGTSFPNIRIPVEEGSLTQELLQSDGPRLINDAEIIQEWMTEFTFAINLSGKSRQMIQKLISQIYKLVGVQSLITVPMISAGEVIGLMDFSRREPFTEGDAKRVAGVVGQVTVAITSLRAEKEKARSQHLLLSLSQAAPVVQRAGNAEEIYNTIGEQAANLGFDVSVFTLSDDKKQLAVSYYGIKSDLVRTIEKLTNLSAENYSFPLKTGGYFHKIITDGETIYNQLDIKPINEILPRLLRPLANKVMDLFKNQQSIFAPLIVRGEVFGLLSFSGSDLNEFDVPAITTFANQAAIALEKTRLFQETQELAAFNENIVQSMSEGIVLEDAEGIFTFVNPAAASILGYTTEELVGKHRMEIIPPDQQPLVLEVEDRRKRGQADQYELDLVCKDGRRVSALVSGNPRIDKEGHFIGTLAVFTDITHLKRTEEKNLRFSRIFEDSLNEIYLFETDTLKFTQVNSAGQDNLGYTMEELLELTTLDIKPEITAKSFAKLVAPLRKGESERVVFETVHKRKDGSLYDVEIHLQLLHYENDPLFSAIILDITERKGAEDAMLKYMHQLETLNTTTAALSTSLELDHVLELILGQIGQVLPFDSGAIFLHEKGGLRVMADRGIRPSIKGDVFPDDNKLFGEIQQSQKPLIVDNVKDDPRFQNWGLSENIKNWMGVPLIVRGTLIGFLTLDSIQPGAYSEEQADLALTFASQAAQAIENARQVSDAQNRMKQLDSLLNIDQAIMGSFDLKVTLNIILEHLLAQLAVDAAAVLSYQADLQTLQFTQGRGFQTTALQYTNLRLGEGYAGEVGLQRNHVFIPDLNQVEGKFKESPQFSREGFVSYYGVPLIAKGKLVGVLEIFHRSPLDPDDEWVNYLRLLAGQVAIAIDNITLFNDLQRSNVDLTLSYDATIEGWASALELKDMETEGHSRRVVELTMDMARRMGISGEKLGHIRRGALLHDIGKMGIPDAILQKPGKLTDEEWQIIKQHPVYAYEWLSRIEYLRPALDIPYYHHEKWDGSGYPRGLEGEQIPLEARIFAIVDVWDALNSDRPYRKAWSKGKTLAHIKEGSGKHFDPQVVDAFVEMIETNK